MRAYKLITMCICLGLYLVVAGCGSGEGEDGGSTTVSGEVKLSGQATIIDDQITLNSLESDSIETQNLVFSEETTETQNIAIGDILVFGISDKTPLGLSRKVLSVQRNEGITTIVTEQASLDEVIEEGSINISGFLSPNSPPTTNNTTTVQSAVISRQSAFSNNNIKIVNSLPGVSIYTGDEYRKLETKNFSASVASDFNGCVGNHDYVATLAPDTEIATNVFASGCIAFSLSDSVFDVDVSLLGGLERINFSVTPTVTSQLTIDHNSSIGLAQEYNILTIRLPSVAVGVVVVTPEVDVVVGVEANAAANVLTGAITDASATIGVEYADNEWTPNFQRDVTFDPLQPTVNTNAEVLVYGGPEIQLLIYKSVGVQSNLHGYISLTANHLNDPWWLLYGGLRAGLGVTAEVFGKELATWAIPDLISYEIEITRAAGATCSSNHLVLCTSSSTCSDAGGNWWTNNTCNSTLEPPSEATCDSSHLVLCTNSSTCSDAEGNWWTNNTCNSTFEPPPEATCDSSHLVLCTNSNVCTNANGYWWSNNTCNSNPEPTYTLSVSNPGDAGVIWSQYVGISCGYGASDCSKVYDAGTTVRLNVNDDNAAGYIFTGWSGACSGTGDCVVSMTSNKSVSANFVSEPKPTYTLSVSNPGDAGVIWSQYVGISCGYGASDCSKVYDAGTTVRLNINDDNAAGYIFTGWSGACSGTGDCVVSMTSNKSVTANF